MIFALFSFMGKYGDVVCGLAVTDAIAMVLTSLSQAINGQTETAS
jgi:hypothetical protein